MERFIISDLPGSKAGLYVASSRISGEQGMDGTLDENPAFSYRNISDTPIDGSLDTMHFNSETLMAYAGDDVEMLDDLIFAMKNELFQYSFQLEMKLINNDMFGFKSIGAKIYEIAVSFGLPLLSSIAKEYRLLQNFNIDYIDNLFVKTKDEIDVLTDLISVC